MVMSLSRVLWKVRSKAPTVTASVQGTVSVTGEGYTTIRDSTQGRRPSGDGIALAAQSSRLSSTSPTHGSANPSYVPSLSAMASHWST